jgi:hypothetical protein
MRNYQKYSLIYLRPILPVEKIEYHFKYFFQTKLYKFNIILSSRTLMRSLVRHLRRALCPAWYDIVPRFILDLETLTLEYPLACSCSGQICFLFILINPFFYGKKITKSVRYNVL